MDYLNIGRSFSVLHRRFQLLVMESCGELQLTYSEYVLLIRLFRSEGVSQEEIAGLLFLDKAVVTRTIALLEKKGLVRREKDRQDKRVKRIYPTELARSWQGYLEGILREWALHLGADIPEREIAIFVAGIQKAAEKACRTNISDFVRGMKERYHAHA